MLLVADHDLGDRDLAGFLERPDEQPVGLLGAVLRLEVVGLAEVDRVDLVQVDEVADVDRLRQLDVEPIEVLVVERDIAALLDLEAADDVVVVDVLPRVAPTIRTGTLTSPKEIVPVQRERATCTCLPFAGLR